MNKEGIVLKTHKPFISTIPEHSHMMSTIERTSEAWNWFLNFYIQLRVQDSPASVLNLNFCYGDNVRMIKNCPLFETYCIPRLLFEEGADNIESFMHFSLEHGYYLYFQADRYWLRPSEFYSEDHTAHDIMVVGTEGENVYIQDFFYGEYSQESCPIEDVVMAFEDFGKECPGKGFSEVIIFKPKQGYTYEFAVQMVKDLVNDYSRGQNSTRRFSPTSIPMSRLDMWYSYGTKIYSAFRRHIDYVKESRGLLETRSFHILYSHKEMILELLGFGEHSGNGVPDIFSVWEKAGLSEPTIEEHFGEDGPNKTIVTLPLMAKDLALYEKRPEKGPEKGPEKKSDLVEKRIGQIYEFIKEKPTISRAELGRKMNLSDKQIRTAITSLKERGIIHREGSDRSGMWIIDK